MIAGLFAQLVVTDDEAAVAFWTRALGREPDARPMAGLTEWHWPTDRAEGEHPSFGVQVWVDPDRAGKSNVTAFEADLDAAVERLDAAGVAHDGPTPGGGARTVAITDPDGNRLVLVG